MIAIFLTLERLTHTHTHTHTHTRNKRSSVTWSERLYNVLNQIDTEFVFHILEDFFIQSEFNSSMFDRVLDYMRGNSNVGCVHLSPNGRVNPLPDEMFFERNFDSLNITVTAVIWRRDFLLKLLRKHENIWQFEWYSGIRAKSFYSEKVVQYNESYPIIYDYAVNITQGYGIFQGKWLVKNKELFDQYGIEVNYDNLGICNTDYGVDGVDKPTMNNNPYSNSKGIIAFMKRYRCHVKNRINAFKSTHK